MSQETSLNHIQPLERLALVNELGRMVLATPDLDELFRNAVQLIKARLDLQHVMVGTIDYDKREIVTRATAGMDPSLASQQPGQGIHEGIIGEAIESAKTVVISDVSESPRYLKTIPTTRSELCLPLKVADSVVGFLNIESDRVGAFEQADVELLEAIGSFLGQAIRNSQLRLELEESKNYLESVVQYAGDAIVTFDREGHIRTWNNAAERILGRPRDSVIYKNVLELIHGSVDQVQTFQERILSGEVVQGLQIKYVSNAGQMHNLELSMAPVMDRSSKVVGISCIIRDVTAKIEAEAELQRNLGAMQLLNEVSMELTSILDLDRLLDKIAQIVRQFIDYELFAILLVDEERREFVWKTSIGYSEESYRELKRLGIDEGVVGKVVRTRQPIVVQDVQKESAYKAARTQSGKDPQSELVLPLIAKDRLVGVLVLESTQRAYFQAHHVRLLTPLAAQIAVAIENASLYEEKSRDAVTKQVMNEIAKEMTAILELDELLNRIAVLVRRVIQYEILGIFLYRPESDTMELKVSIGYSPESVEQCRSLPASAGILGRACREHRLLLVRDQSVDPDAIQVKSLEGRWSRSAVAVPIIARDQLLGGLVVESSVAGYFTPEHLQILETLASQMAVSIDNARLFAQVLAKEMKLEADFTLARDLQSSMLPVAVPALNSFEMVAYYKPAESLGGDYYDFIWIDHQLLGLAIGDVSGKGVAAAMTMAAARSALRFAARIHTSPSQVLYHANRRLFRDVKKRTYLSLFYGVLNVEERNLRWCNGGHFPPILVRTNGSLEELSRGGTVLAMFDKSRYASANTQLQPGDVLCLYTDGLIESRNPAEEEFGRDRLTELLARKVSQPAREILKAINAELKKFTRGAEQHDDITVVILKAREDI